MLMLAKAATVIDPTVWLQGLHAQPSHHVCTRLGSLKLQVWVQLSPFVSHSPHFMGLQLPELANAQVLG